MMKTMDIIKLEQLSQKRSNHVHSGKANNDHSHRILATDLYSEENHFIFELLQNAEDEGAKTVWIEVSDRELRFQHDGRPFDLADIEAITTFGNNQRKKEKRNAIGRFGIGFKSVFAITDTPCIKSNGVAFKIKDFIVPTDIRRIQDKGTTEFILPFNGNTSRKKAIAEGLSDALSGLDYRHLLFLNNLKRISWKAIWGSGDDSGELVRNHRLLNGSRKLARVSIKNNGPRVTYVLGERPVKLPGKAMSVKLALLEGKDGALEEVDESPLFAFFPLETLETNLAFLVHAPFLTTAARDNILVENEVNEMLRGELDSLLRSMVHELARLGKLGPHVWNVLPCDPTKAKNSPVYERLHRGLIEECMERKAKWIGSTHGQLRAASQVMIPDPEEMVGLLTASQANSFFGRSAWLPDAWWNELDEDVTAFFQNQLEIPVFSLDYFRKELDWEFLADQADDWLNKLYAVILHSGKTADWRGEGIIRIQSGSMTAAYNPEGNLQVFLPGKGKESFATVKESLLRDETSLNFFKELDVRPRKPFDELLDLILPRIERHKQPYKGYEADLKSILGVIGSEDLKPSESKVILSRLRKTRFLPARLSAGKPQVLVGRTECFYPTKSVRKVLSSVEEIYWLDTEFLGGLMQDGRFTDLLTELEIQTVPFKVPGLGMYDFRDFSSFANTVAREMKTCDTVLGNIKTLGASVDLWCALLSKNSLYPTHPSRILSLDAATWNGHRKLNEIPAKLRKKRWLFNKEGKQQAPVEMTIGQLHGNYPQNLQYSSEMISLLHFKEDEIVLFEDRHPGKKVVDKEEYQEYLAFKKEKKRLAVQRKREQEIAKTKVLLDPTKVNGEEFFLGQVASSGLQGPLQAGRPDKRLDLVHVTHVARSRGTDYSVAIAPEQEDIGQWGESYVEQILKARCKEDPELDLIVLNNEEAVSVGKDFQVYRSGYLVEVIEVKTTANGMYSPLKLSERQWEQATTYHLLNGPVSYWVYCVFQANSKNPKLVKIKDPVAELESGKIVVNDLVFRISG